VRALIDAADPPIDITSRGVGQVTDAARGRRGPPRESIPTRSTFRTAVAPHLSISSVISGSRRMVG
jgi:hypothetical protein